MNNIDDPMGGDAILGEANAPDGNYKELDTTSFLFYGYEPRASAKARKLLAKLNYDFAYARRNGRVVDDFYQVYTLSKHLRGQAADWWLYNYGNDVPNWQTFVDAFIARFAADGEYEERHLRTRYRNFVQGSLTADKYIQLFEECRLSMEPGFESEESALIQFTNRLRSQLKTRVVAQLPRTLSEAQFLARSLDMNNGFSADHRYHYRRYDRGFNREPQRDPDAMDVDKLRRRFENSSRNEGRSHQEGRNGNRNNYYGRYSDRIPTAVRVIGVTIDPIGISVKVNQIERRG